MNTSGENIRYLERSIIFNEFWRISKNTCTTVDTEEFYISMDRPAPALRDQPPPPPPPKKPLEPKQPPKSLIEEFKDFHKWLNTPTTPKPPVELAAPAITKARVKPFDIQDIPDVMDRIGWPMSAKLQRKWFAGELNYVTTDEGAVSGINQDGNPFPSSMIDTTMFKLDWILKFPRAKKNFDDLLKNKIFNKAATRALARKFSKIAPSSNFIDSW